MACTTFMSTPAASDRVAAPWRRSCSRIGGRPACRVRNWKWSVTSAGCRALPSGSVNTSPVSTLPGVVVGEHGDWAGVQGDDGVGVSGSGFGVAGLPAVLHGLVDHLD